MFRLQASSGGYLVRRAPDPNHQSDAAVQQMAENATIVCTRRIFRLLLLNLIINGLQLALRLIRITAGEYDVRKG
jgi:hypothetical protein